MFMVNIIELLPGQKVLTSERCIVVFAHPNLHIPDRLQAYFYDSDKGDHGGGGPFDFSLEEAKERAVAYARELGVISVYITYAKVSPQVASQ